MKKAFVLRIESRGLAQDKELLAPILRRCGYEVCEIVHPMNWRDVNTKWKARMDTTPEKDDLVIFIENLCMIRDIIRSPARKIYIPNAEMTSDEQIQNALALCDEVWHKCDLSKKVFQLFTSSEPLDGDLLQVSTAFTSRDLFMPNVPKQWKNRILHMYGTSYAKGTADLVKLWAAHPQWPTLTLIGHPAFLGDPHVLQKARNIEYMHSVDNQMHPFMMNAHGIHICTSSAEGWGHYIVEAMSCGAVVLTTDAPPMNEHVRDGDTGFIIPIAKAFPFRDHANRVLGDWRGNNTAKWNYFSPEGFAKVLEKVLAMPDAELQAVGGRAREWYLRNHRQFEETIENRLRS
jgi:glycosyltransferase involved in cell wall biosynthesis